MPEENKQIQEDETPTMKKLRALVAQVGAGTIAYETVVPQAAITIMVIGAAIYLTVTNQPVPDWLTGTVGLVIGFYFGSDYEFRQMTGKAKSHGR